ncbi:hypothetical protein [Bradyrhizobium sp. TM239]|uniref:hypothetical protein n=1 Tax=Bradyrhizobium sp. TM239 TaxID=2599802 RepID=UPI0027D5802C|nr:hypothetical protein TM239_01980 [Bradyrhizobium sp. TM239]
MNPHFEKHYNIILTVISTSMQILSARKPSFPKTADQQRPLLVRRELNVVEANSLPSRSIDKDDNSDISGVVQAEVTEPSVELALLQPTRLPSRGRRRVGDAV